MHKTGCTLEGRWRKRKGISLPFLLTVHCRGELRKPKRDAELFSPVPSLSCQFAPTSLHQQAWHAHTHTHPQTCTHVLCVHATLMHTAPCNLLSPNYSRLEPMLLSLILSARGLWGNSDISVWCLAYVSRALPGPIKLIFNVCPTLDGPSQGWHSSRGDVIGVWRRPHCALGCSQLDLWESITDVLPSHNWLKHLQWTKPATQYRDRPSTNI